MTTIAYRDGVLAADRRVSDGHSIIGEDRKIVMGYDCLAGAGGRADCCEMFIQWVLAGRPDDDLPDIEAGQLHAITIEADGQILVWQNIAAPFPITAPFLAVGSGDEFAIGAMEMGADAKTAVEVASRRDLATGGGIDILTLDDLRAKMAERQAAAEALEALIPERGT